MSAKPGGSRFSQIRSRSRSSKPTISFSSSFTRPIVFRKSCSTNASGSATRFPVFAPRSLPTVKGNHMSIINYASKEIQFKIVYYGPALCGKTTNLAYVHSQINPDNRGELVSLATAADRTLFFDFLPLHAVTIKNFKTKFQLYTVPGQVIYNTTRQLVLRSVDGIVFVADSQWDKMEENIESFKNMEDNLAKQNVKIDDVPYVLQFNKRDLPRVAPAHY